MSRRPTVAADPSDFTDVKVWLPPCFPITLVRVVPGPLRRREAVPDSRVAAAAEARGDRRDWGEREDWGGERGGRPDPVVRQTIRRLWRPGKRQALASAGITVNRQAWRPRMRAWTRWRFGVGRRAQMWPGLHPGLTTYAHDPAGNLEPAWPPNADQTDHARCRGRHRQPVGACRRRRRGGPCGGAIVDGQRRGAVA